MSDTWESKLLDMRLWRTIKIASVALLVIGSAVMTNHFLHTLAVQSNELEQTKLQLQKPTTFSQAQKTNWDS